MTDKIKTCSSVKMATFSPFCYSTNTVLCQNLKVQFSNLLGLQSSFDMGFNYSQADSNGFYNLFECFKIIVVTDF